MKKNKKRNDNFLRNFYSKKNLNRIDEKINLLGVSSNYSTLMFLNIRLITMIILAIIIFVSFEYGYIYSLIFAVIYYFLFEKIFLDNKIKKRTKKLNSEAIYFFEVLTLSLQTGRNLNEAISVTVNSIDGELSLEFKEGLRQTKFGKSLNESLSDIQKFIPSDSINNIILSLTQSNMYGSSIIDTMHSQIDYLRQKRILEVKSMISKVPVKISVISVFFFIPLILLIILGPVLLSYIG
ncbi:MAG: type II secretion system F family protein [Bacilli bacterium]